MDKAAPVGFVVIRLEFVFDSDAEEDEVAKLVQLTETYCVVLQTVSGGTKISVKNSKKRG